MSTGLFIVLEGIDGAGTTTQARLLVDWLRAAGRQVVLTAEPTDGPVGALLRAVLGRNSRGGRRPRRTALEQKQQPLPFPPDHVAGFLVDGRLEDERTLALLFAADRSDHLHSTILRALDAGRVVISDRYYLSSVAYQSTGVPVEWVEDLNREFRRPDLTILIDVPAEECARRMENSRSSKERYEYKTRLEKIRANYLLAADRARAAGERITQIDGTKPINDVHGEIRKLLTPLLPPPGEGGDS